MSRLSHMLPLALVAALGLAGCAAERTAGIGSRNSALPPPGPGGGGGSAPVAARTYVAPPPAAERRLIPETPLGEGRLNSGASLTAACNQQADRMLVQQDRSEIMREDERDSRQGTFGSPYQFRAPIDQMARRFDRDRIARECVTRNTRGTPDR